MISTFTAFTEEIDIADDAINEILDQLDFEQDLRKNSVGIIHCFNEFVENGIVKKLSEKLPFEIVGCTTMSASARGIMSEMALILTVFTSDDVEFSIGVSAAVESDVDKPVKDLCGEILGKHEKKPSLLMTFIPYTTNIPGDEFVIKINEYAKDISAFGTVAISNNINFEDSYTICNGEAYRSSLVLLALSGKVDPSFYTVSVMGDLVSRQKAVITSADRNIIKTINDVTAGEYLEAAGIIRDGDVSGLGAMPFIFELENGSRLVRTVIGITPEGYVVFAGFVPVLSSFTICFMEAHEVLSSAENTMNEVMQNANGKTLLIYSCAGRNWALGLNSMLEHKKISDSVKEMASFFCAYSGGEVYPSQLKDGRIVNYIQNNSLTVCVI